MRVTRRSLAKFALGALGVAAHNAGQGRHYARGLADFQYGARGRR